MRIKYRHLNGDETYCCSKQAITSTFGENDIDVDFGYMGFRDPKYNSTYTNKKYAKQGAVLLLSMIVYKNHELLNYTMKPFIHIYIIKKDNYNKELESEFNDEILPQLFHLYLAHRDDDIYEGRKSFKVEVWLKEGKFHLESNN